MMEVERMEIDGKQGFEYVEKALQPLYLMF